MISKPGGFVLVLVCSLSTVQSASVRGRETTVQLSGMRLAHCGMISGREARWKKING